VDTVFWAKGKSEEQDALDPAEISKQLLQLKSYQLVILDGRPFDGMTDEQLGLLRDFVTRDAGSLLVIANEDGPWYGEALASLIGACPLESPSENSLHLAPTRESAGNPIVSLAPDGAEGLA
jgi:hypothetical protein